MAFIEVGVCLVDIDRLGAERRARGVEAQPGAAAGDHGERGPSVRALLGPGQAEVGGEQLATGEGHRLGRGGAGTQALIDVGGGLGGEVVAYRLRPADRGRDPAGHQLRGQAGGAVAAAGRVARRDHDQLRHATGAAQGVQQLIRADRLAGAELVFHQQPGAIGRHHAVAAEVDDVVRATEQAAPQLVEAAVLDHAQLGAAILNKAADCREHMLFFALVVEHRLGVLGRERHEQDAHAAEGEAAGRSQRAVAELDRQRQARLTRRQRAARVGEQCPAPAGGRVRGQACGGIDGHRRWLRGLRGAGLGAQADGERGRLIALGTRLQAPGQRAFGAVEQLEEGPAKRSVGRGDRAALAWPLRFRGGHGLDQLVEVGGVSGRDRAGLLARGLSPAERQAAVGAGGDLDRVGLCQLLVGRGVVVDRGGRRIRGGHRESFRG